MSRDGELLFSLMYIFSMSTKVRGGGQTFSIQELYRRSNWWYTSKAAIWVFDLIGSEHFSPEFSIVKWTRGKHIPFRQYFGVVVIVEEYRWKLRLLHPGSEPGRGSITISSVCISMAPVN
jgi:hypothetical protein